MKTRLTGTADRRSAPPRRPVWARHGLAAKSAAVSIAFATTLVAGVHGQPTARKPDLTSDYARIIESIPAAKINSASREAVMRGLEHLRANRLEDASRQLNSALQLDPANSYLQLVNAFAYHQMGRAGEAQKLELAEQGYLLAVKFDASNWVAHYLLGMLYFEQRDFRGAQQALAEVLLSLGEDEEVLFRLVAASYYAGDPVTAAAGLQRLRLMSPNDPQILRLSALVSAAINQPEEAQSWVSAFEATRPSSRELAELQARLRHWAVVHRSRPTASLMPSTSDQLGKGTGGRSAGEPAMIDTQARSPFNPFGNPTNRPGGSGPSGNPGGPFQQGNPFQQGGPFQQGQGSGPDLERSASSKRMVLVDVVIMRTEDSLSSRRGVNLMNALTLQFGGSGPALARTYSRQSGEQGASSTTTLTRAITVPALSYSLNIVNSNTNLNEVLARPTLVALEGMSSEFFSGTTLNAAVVSTNAVGGSAVQVEKEIGVKLSVLPTFLEDNKIRLTVDAQRTFLKPPSQDVSFTYKLETSKIMVNANVVMEFGETLVLGGLSEKEVSNTRDGVPLLQDVPGLQYLFSSRDTNSFQRSVLMLITPRAPQYAYRSNAALAAAGAEAGGEDSLKELRARYGDWFKPYPNLASVYNQLNQSSLYREFRTGDVTMEKWDRQDKLLDRLKHALDFLFY